MKDIGFLEMEVYFGLIFLFNNFEVLLRYGR